MGDSFSNFSVNSSFVKPHHWLNPKTRKHWTDVYVSIGHGVVENISFLQTGPCRLHLVQPSGRFRK